MLNILIQASLVFLRHSQIITPLFHNLSRKRSLGMHRISGDDHFGNHRLLQRPRRSHDLILLLIYGF